MAFDDEIVKRLRNRAAYLDFSQSYNPTVAQWPGPSQTLFGCLPDNRGPVPITGTVENFGTFNRGVANADFAPEIPSLTVVLFDPDHYWRERAQRPSTDLRYRWIALYLRVADDAGDIFDRRLAIGQITAPDFPPRKRAALDIQLSGGKWLGELIPRRTITLEDFPRASPENLGKAVPIIFGVFSNEVATADGDVFTTVGCLPKQQILIQESWGNGNGTAFADGSYWEAYPAGTDPIDLLYPTLSVAEAVEVYPDMFGYGVNGLWVHSNFNPAPPDLDWIVAGVAYRNLGTLPGYPWSTAFDATEMWSRFTYYPDQYVLAYDEPYCPLYTVWPDFGYDYRISVVAQGFGSTTIPARNGVYTNIPRTQDPNDLYLEISYSLFEDLYQGAVPGFENWQSVIYEANIRWGARADLLDTKQEFVVCHKCGTYTYDPNAPIDDPADGASVASDGYLRVYCNGKQVFSVENVPLIVEEGFYTDAGTDSSNRAYTVSFGWAGFVGPLTNILVTAGATEAGLTTRCQDTPGITENMASGALRALLVDTGAPLQVLDANQIPVGFTQDTSLPTVNSQEAHNVWDGGTIAQAVFFYVAARKEDGTIGPLSTIVDLDNDYDPDQDPHGASISWRAAGSATAYVVWMSTDANFHPVTRPTLGNPRTKTIKAETGSTFDPISGDPFDYQIIFTSLSDGAAYSSPAYSDTRYLLAGHTLQSVDQVYVLKPVATVTEDSEVNTLTAAVAQGATTCTVVFNDDATKFREDQVVIIAGDPEPYTITSSASGTLQFTPGARRDFASGTVVSHTQQVDTQVLLSEGRDYTQEVIEVNGNRYHTLVFAEAQQDPETCQAYEITANVRGSEINADGTGTLITDGVSITQHFFKNWIFNDYRSSVGPYAPVGGRWFEDVPYAPGLIDNDSFYAANLVSSGRVDGNYQGAGALTEQIPASQLIHDLLTSFDLDLYYDDGAWHVDMLSTESVVRASLPSLTAADTVEDTFHVQLGMLPHNTVIPYFAGPMTGRVVGVNSNQTGGYVVAGEVRDSTAISVVGQQIGEPMYLIWTRHAPTAYDVAYRRLRYRRYPSIHASLSYNVGALTSPLAGLVKVTHPDGLGASGWTNRVCRIMRADLDLDEMVIHLLLHDIDDLVPA